MKTFLAQCQSQEKTATAGADLVPKSGKSGKGSDYLKVGSPGHSTNGIIQKIISFFKKQDVGDLVKQAQKVKNGEMNLADLKGVVNWGVSKPIETELLPIKA